MEYFNNPGALTSSNKPRYMLNEMLGGSPQTISTFRRKEVIIYVKWFCFEVQWSGVKWSEVKWSELRWSSWGQKVPSTLGWPYTVGTWLYCDYLIWCVSCTVVVLTCFVMCGCFGNMCTCIYCVLYCLYCVLFVLFRLCISSLICFVCTSVRTTATEWKLNCSKE